MVRLLIEWLPRMAAECSLESIATRFHLASDMGFIEHRGAALVGDMQSCGEMHTTGTHLSWTRFDRAHAWVSSLRHAPCCHLGPVRWIGVIGRTRRLRSGASGEASDGAGRESAADAGGHRLQSLMSATHNAARPPWSATSAGALELGVDRHRPRHSASR